MTVINSSEYPDLNFQKIFNHGKWVKFGMTCPLAPSKLDDEIRAY